MEKTIIKGNESLTIILEGGEILTKNGEITEEFFDLIKECEELEQLRDLMKESDAIAGEEIVKNVVTKEEWDKFIEQERGKIIALNKDVRKYYIYENEEGICKLAVEALINLKSFQEKNNKIMGNLEDLYQEQLQQLIKSRIIEI